MARNHLIAFVIGFVLDQIIGDPHSFPHPIRLIGSLISFLDKKLLGDNRLKERNKNKERALGTVLCAVVIFLTALVVTGVVFLSYAVSPFVGIAVDGNRMTRFRLASDAGRIFRILRGDEEGDLYPVTVKDIEQLVRIRAGSVVKGQIRDLAIGDR